MLMGEGVAGGQVQRVSGQVRELGGRGGEELLGTRLKGQCNEIVFIQERKNVHFQQHSNKPLKNITARKVLTDI